MSSLAVPVINTLVCCMSFLATDTQLCVLQFIVIQAYKISIQMVQSSAWLQELHHSINK